MSATVSSGSITVSRVHGSDAVVEVIAINEDRLRVILHDHAASLTDKRAWWTPAGIVLTLVIAFLTTEFKSALGLSADSWKAVFVVALVLASLVLIKELARRRKAATADSLVDEIKRRAAGTGR